MMMKKLET